MPSQATVRLLRNAIILLLAAQAIALTAIPSGLSGSVSKEDLDARAGATGAREASSSDEPPASSTSTTSTGESPPVVQAVIDGTLGDGGWYTGDVSISWTITDEETAATPGEGCVDGSVTADTTGQTFSCTATSEGGSTTTTATIARDATAPTDVTVATDRDPDHDGWFNAPFTATWTGADPTSGIAACTSTEYTGPDAEGATLDGSCTDEAGNTSGSVPLTFSYDATLPAVEGRFDRAADHDGWYNAAVTITWVSEDARATCDAPTEYSGPDSATASATGTCTDQAGNVGSATVGFKYDASAPSIDLRAPEDDTFYILRQPVAADYSCSDGTADIASCTGTVADGAAIDTGSVGSKTFTVTAVDQAGNETTTSASYGVRYNAAGVDCGGVAGHQILSPIDLDGSSRHKSGSTVPAKFRVCDYFGDPVTSAGVVESFRRVRAGTETIDEPVASTSNHDEFRAGASQWIFNIATRGLTKTVHGYRIALNDGTSIDFSFLLT